MNWANLIGPIKKHRHLILGVNLTLLFFIFFCNLLSLPEIKNKLSEPATLSFQTSNVDNASLRFNKLNKIQNKFLPFLPISSKLQLFKYTNQHFHLIILYIILAKSLLDFAVLNFFFFIAYVLNFFLPTPLSFAGLKGMISSSKLTDFTAFLIIFSLPAVYLKWALINPSMFDPLKVAPSFTLYPELSRHIFSMQTKYYAESILAPLLGKILGAYQYSDFNLLNLFLSYSFLVVFYLFLRKQSIPNTAKLALLALLSINTLFVSFIYYTNFPDPLTAIGTTMILFSTNPYPIIVGAFIGTMSHCSSFLFTALVILILRYTGNEFSNQKMKLQFPLLVGLGYLLGKIVLKFWGICFNYAILESRSMTALSRFKEYWPNTLNLHTLLFDLQPIYISLILCCLFLIFIFYNTRFAFGIVVCISLALFAQAITNDIPRMFSVIFWPVIVYAILEFFRINLIPPRYKHGFTIALCIVTAISLSLGYR